MGIVGSRVEEGSALYLRDQNRFSVAGLTITNSRGRLLLQASPNAFPAARYSVKRDSGDDSPIDYVQDPDSGPTGVPPSFSLRLSNDDELNFNFTCILRQQTGMTAVPEAGIPPTTINIDTQLSGSTYVFASNAKEIDQLLTSEFHADPNLHKNPNVQLVGDYSTEGSPSAQFEWSWKWRPPKQVEDRGGGWRNTCSFVEYDQRAHKSNTLASFSFWVQNNNRWLSSPRSPQELVSPPRLRVPSAQSIESRVSGISDSDGPDYSYQREPASPLFSPIQESGLGLVPSITNGTQNQKVDVSCVSRPGDDSSTTEDGPLFRATMKSLEQKTGSMRMRMKKVLRTAEAAESAQSACNDAVSAFMDASRDASASNANAVRPASDHYFEKIAKEILQYEKENATNSRKLIIDPINKSYNSDIKQAESKKRDFDEESKDYYAYVSKYLGQRTESLKEKKRVESDSKYQAKRRTFELKRFDYSSFMHDLHGGRKDQEVLSQLTKYASAQANGYLKTAKKVEEMAPQLEASCLEVGQADKEFQSQRSEREERRRALETNNKLPSSSDGETIQSSGNGSISGDSGLNRAFSYTAGSRASVLATSPPSISGFSSMVPSNGFSPMPGSKIEQGGLPMRQTSSKFRGIRDLEEKDPSMVAANSGQHRKEGLLWSLSRPGSHVDPKGSNKTAWHKFWIVLDQGKLSEYVNWKDKLDSHSDPIDLRVASVREARNSERRFCFEVITPAYTRVYQAPSEEDMKSWITAINNALQSAFEARSPSDAVIRDGSVSQTSSTRKDIAAVLTGKSSSFSGHRAASNASAAAAAAKAVARHATTGDKPNFQRANSDSTALLNQIREADAGNKVCADCGSTDKVEWVSINSGIILCIECSGIHRSLGTHISKIRSLTLDTSAFTPDIIDSLHLIGNRISNMTWEAKLDHFLKPAPHSTREQRLHFITAKYSDRTYVQPLGPGPFANPDEMLLASIKKNDIQNVSYALASRANPNASDRSRGTHAVYLALAAADPASPTASIITTNSSFSHSRGTSTAQSGPGFAVLSTQSSTSVTPSTPPRPGTPGSPQASRKPFPIAESSLQNGADIPASPAPIPLSRAAQMYSEFKTEQRMGKPATPGMVGAKDASGDSLTALPTILAGNGSSPRDREKERERAKRSSVGSTIGLVGKR